MALSTTQYGYIIDPMVPFTDDKGKTIKNGFVRVFVAGSSTPVITYRNFDGATNQDRIELDNSGRTKTSVIGSKGLTYKVCVYDKHHSQESPILTVDKVSAIGANITAGSGATVVTGLDGFRTKPDGFVDASVIGTDGYVALDHTLVTDDLDTYAKVTAVENDRYVPLLNDDVNDPDSKITLKRLRQWANRPTQVVITPSDFLGTGLSNNEWAAAVSAMEDDKTAVVKWTESGASRVAFSSRYEAGVGLVLVSEIGGFVTEYVVAATSGAHTVTTNVYELAGSHSITKFDVMWDNEGNDYVFPAAQDVIQAVSEYIEVQLVFNAPAGVKYIYSLTYKSGARYEWTREDCQGKFTIVRVAGSPAVWGWISGDTSLKNDIGKIGGSIAPAYSSLNFPISEGTPCMYAEELYICSVPGGIMTSEEWDSSHWTKTSVDEILGNVSTALDTVNDNLESVAHAGMYDLGNKTESDLDNGKLAIGAGNSTTKLTLTTVSTLTVLANSGVPNFALVIDNSGNSNNVTITVKDSTNTTTFLQSVSAGNEVTAGKIFQLTCVGNCWTLAEFGTANA